MFRSNSLSVGDLTNAAPHSGGGFPQSPQSADHAETEMLIIKDKSSMEQRYDLEGAHPAGKPVEPEGPGTEADSKVRTANATHTCRFCASTDQVLMPCFSYYKLVFHLNLLQ